MLAHMTVHGAALWVGDFVASGTISGPREGTRDCFLELSWGGAKSWIAGGEESAFLQDSNEVALRYSAPAAAGRANQRIDLGEVRTTVLPAN
jgi:fumarylacetoacetase